MPERDCGQIHYTIDEAIAHAKENLGEPLTQPFWGTRGGKIANVGWVIGYQSDDKQQRFRLDYDPGKGVHVNEEDFTRPTDQERVVHRVRLAMTPKGPDAEEAWKRIIEGRMQLYWHKWTGRYNKPAEVLEAEEDVDRRRRGG
jgi:hypothetical protein